MNKKRAYYYGKISEWIACLFLLLKGYRFLHYDYKSRFGQVDLIVSKKNTLIFVEVKFRKKLATFENIISSKQKQHLINSANYFISKNNSFANKIIRFDAIYIVGFFKIKHFHNIYGGI